MGRKAGKARGEMAKKQSRRSISVRGVTYQKLREHCAGAQISMSDFIEQRIADYFGEEAEPARPAPRPAARPAPAKAPVAKAPVAKAPVAKAPVAKAPPVKGPPSRVALVAAQAAARKAAMTQAPAAPARVPAASTISKKPMPTAALRSSASPEPPPARPAGRPAPTPASEVVKNRVAGKDSKDYRIIRF